MKPFNLELAKQGKPVCTRVGSELSLIGKMKLEVIIKKIDDKTLEEIEQFFL